MRRSLALLLLLITCAGVSTAQKGLTPKQKQADLASLKSDQQKNGGFTGGGFSGPHILGTSIALMAYKAAGAKAPNPALVKKFVLSQWQEGPGGFPDAGPTANVLGTAWGLICLAELKASTPKYEKAGLAFLEKNARNHGDVYWSCLAMEALAQKPRPHPAWVKILDEPATPPKKKKGRSEVVTHTAIVAISRASMGLEVDAAKVLKTLADAQLAGGGWETYAGSDIPDLETTWRVVDCHVRLGQAPPNPKAIRAFVAGLRDKKGGYRFSPKTGVSSAATLYAYKILTALDRLEKKE